MKLKDRIFDVFDRADIGSSSKDLNAEKEAFYMHDDPFDFYRVGQDPDQYVPKTQRGLRKAFSEGLIGIEFFIEMATSLRPLSDEAQDIDEITRLFSQQKLSARPSLQSVQILRNMIKDVNPEIALYAAEGLNSIEKSFMTKIDKIKLMISKDKGNRFRQYYQLGKLYFQFALLQKGQKLIQRFYLNESLNYLRKANSIKKNNIKVAKLYGEVFIQLEKFKPAIKIYEHLADYGSGIEAILKVAQCYYSIGEYDKVYSILEKIAHSTEHLNETTELIVYQWIL